MNWNAEDYGFYKNEPEADIDDEKDDNEGEESNVLDLEKRSTDPESRRALPRVSLPSICSTCFMAPPPPFRSTPSA